MKSKILLILLAVCSSLDNLYAQCAMCRASIESNISSGGDIGSGLNAGILYLASFPYILFAVIAYLWYHQSKKHREKSIKNRGYTLR